MLTLTSNSLLKDRINPTPSPQNLPDASSLAVHSKEAIVHRMLMQQTFLITRDRTTSTQISGDERNGRAPGVFQHFDAMMP